MKTFAWCCDGMLPVAALARIPARSMFRRESDTNCNERGLGILPERNQT
jgi:hypothetical protein